MGLIEVRESSAFVSQVPTRVWCLCLGACLVAEEAEDHHAWGLALHRLFVRVYHAILLLFVIAVRLGMGFPGRSEDQAFFSGDYCVIPVIVEACHRERSALWDDESGRASCLGK
jgi:hypothetical protein